MRLPIASVAAPELEAPGFIDFSKATLPASPAVAGAAERAAARLPAHLGLSGFDPVGLISLRQLIADRYTQRGLPTRVDEVMITTGAQHAIGLIARTLLSRGDRVLIENPSYPHAIEAFAGGGGRPVPVPVSTDDGWDLDALAQGLARQNPALGYLMPDNHNPTGRTMPAEHRARALDLAARQGTLLIADETMGELGFGATPPPFATHAPAGATTITIGSVGKSIWGGLRIGWIRSTAAIIQRLARARAASDLGTPIMDQLMVADLLPRYDELLVDRRTQLREGYEAVRQRLATAFPQWRVPDVAGGLTLWVNLGAPLSSQLALAARSAGLLLPAGPRFSVDAAHERFVRIPFCLPRPDLDAGLDALERAWATVQHAPMQDSDLYADVA